MHLTISFSDGRRADAVVLAVSADRMRISLPGSDDATELRAAHGAWFTETGEPVDIDSIVLLSDGSSLFPEISPAVRGAAGVGVV